MKSFIHVLKEKPMNFKDEILSLNKKTLNLINLLREISKKLNIKIYLVGGSVRDLILKKRNFDLDFVTEGSAIKVCEQLSKILNCECIYNSQFLTAKLNFEDKTLDFATARREKYLFPGALPKVSMSNLREDLFRRDFTINAMAISLNESDFGTLYDFYNGYQDLKEKIIRVLHPKSFLDDPTRIFRGIRFKERLNFNFDRLTFSLMLDAIKKNALFTIDEHRIKDEIFLILREEGVAKYLKSIQKICSFRFINKKIKLDKKDLDFIDRLEKNLTSFSKRFKLNLDKASIILGVMFSKLNKKEIAEIYKRFGYKKTEQKIFLDIKKINILKNYLKKVSSSSKLYFLLKSLSNEALYVLYQKSKKFLRKKIEFYLEELRFVKIQTTGDFLKKLGVKEGPIYSEIFKKVLLKKLEAKIKDRAEEEAYIKKLLKTQVK